MGGRGGGEEEEGEVGGRRDGRRERGRGEEREMDGMA